jgi:hypothetical protein
MNDPYRNDLPIVFVNEITGEPLLISHQTTDPSRQGKPITDQELMDFAVDLLAYLYTKQGMKIKSENRIATCEYPNLVLQNNNGTVFFIAIKIARFPANPLSLSKAGYDSLNELAQEAGAVPLFCPLSFGCATNATSFKDLANTIAGGKYFVAFRGAQSLEYSTGDEAINVSQYKTT